MWNPILGESHSLPSGDLMSHPVPWEEEPYLPEDDASEEEWQQTTQKEENEQQP